MSGKLIEALPKIYHAIVNMLWDAMPDCNNKGQENMEMTLSPSKCNDNCDHAWQLDVEPDKSGSDSISDNEYRE